MSFWNDFSCEKHIKERIYDSDGTNDTGTLIAEITLEPNEKKKVKFVLAWNVPNNYNYWNECKNDDKTHKIWKNYYATVFENSLQTAVYSLKNWDDLYNRTLKFKETLHQSTLPKEVIDAASSNLSVLKTATVLRLGDGSFYGWEGMHELEGSCEGTCQHVWNYAYALCFLFPDLERSIRDMELFGPSSWLEGMYLAALKAASEMAEFLGDNKKAQEYREVFDKGYQWTKENLFNGKYFIQKNRYNR